MWLINILLFNLMIVFICELPAAFALGARSPLKITTAALINVLTNPPAVICSLCITLFLNSFETALIFVLEITIFLIEGFMFSKFKIFCARNPYLISFLLNAISFTAGEIINIFL